MLQPGVDTYDPFDAQVQSDPYPWYRALRETAPCHHVVSRDLWVLSRHQDVVKALRDTARFTSTEGTGYERRALPQMAFLDPPEHTRLRRLVAREFTPRRVARLRDDVERLVTALLDPLLEAGEGDWVSQFAHRLPIAVIARLLGIPDESLADLRRWSDQTVADLGGGLDAEAAARSAAAIDEFAAFLSALLTQRARASPTDNLLGVLVRAREGEEGLNERELLSFCILLLVAGNETVASHLGNLLCALIAHPPAWSALREGAVPALAAVEEALRWDAPVQGFCRTATTDSRVGDHMIPAGARVLMLFGSANRDPHVFEAPDEFDVSRGATAHIAFGAGVHACLGAALARLQGEVVTHALVERVKFAELAAEPVRTCHPLLRGMRSLRVALTPAS